MAGMYRRHASPLTRVSLLSSNRWRRHCSSSSDGSDDSSYSSSSPSSSMTPPNPPFRPSEAALRAPATHEDGRPVRENIVRLMKDEFWKRFRLPIGLRNFDDTMLQTMDVETFSELGRTPQNAMKDLFPDDEWNTDTRSSLYVANLDLKTERVFWELLGRPETEEQLYEAIKEKTPEEWEDIRQEHLRTLEADLKGTSGPAILPLLRTLEVVRSQKPPFSASTPAGEFTKVVRQWPEMMPPYSAPMMRDPELDKEAERLRLKLYGEDTSKNNLASEDAIDAITLGDERVPVQTVIEVDAETQEKVHPEGYGVDWEVMKEMTGYDLLVRPCGYQLIAELAQRQANGFDVALAGNNRGSILLDGPEGVGRSGLINLATHWARRNGWVVLRLDVDSWAGNGALQRCRLNPTVWDQPDVAVEILSAFLVAHGEQLENVPLRTKLKDLPEWEERNATNLADLVRYGVEDIDDRSGEVLLHVRHELGMMTEYPLLLAVDSFSKVFHDRSMYADPDSDKFSPAPLHMRKLALSEMVLNSEFPALVNGVALCATGGAFIPAENQVEARTYWTAEATVVPPYTLDESVAISAHYYKLQHLTHFEPTRATVMHWHMMASGRPGHFKEVASHH